MAYNFDIFTSRSRRWRFQWVGCLHLWLKSPAVQSVQQRSPISEKKKEHITMDSWCDWAPLSSNVRILLWGLSGTRPRISRCSYGRCPDSVGIRGTAGSGWTAHIKRCSTRTAETLGGCRIRAAAVRLIFFFKKKYFLRKWTFFIKKCQ